MSTTLQPALGASLLVTQGGQGASPGYSAIDRRRAYTADLQEGAIGGLDFKVAQRAAGANMSVDIGMPAGGLAYVKGDSVPGQGLYAVPCHSVTVNEAITAAHATLPRIDQIILRVYDTAHDASGQSIAAIERLTGTATSGATLDNRTGVAALPATAMRLADILVPAASTTVTAANIRDRRTWARGAFYHVISRAGDYVAPAGFAYVDPGILLPRMELSGVPVRVTLSVTGKHSTSNGEIVVIMNGLSIGTTHIRKRYPVANADLYHTIVTTGTPAGSSVSIGPSWQGAGATWYANSANGLEFTIQEIVRGSASN